MALLRPQGAPWGQGIPWVLEDACGQTTYYQNLQGGTHPTSTATQAHDRGPVLAQEAQGAPARQEPEQLSWNNLGPWATI